MENLRESRPLRVMDNHAIGKNRRELEDITQVRRKNNGSPPRPPSSPSRILDLPRRSPREIFSPRRRDVKRGCVSELGKDATFRGSLPRNGIVEQGRGLEGKPRDVRLRESTTE